MTTIKKLVLAGCLVLAAAGVQAAVLSVEDLTITGFSFTLNPPVGGGFDQVSASNGFIASDTDLIAGARNPVLGFDLDPVDFGVRTESWQVVAYTTAASPATVDTAGNFITIDLAAFATDWSDLTSLPGQGRCTPGSFPNCVGLAQGPVGGVVTGAWTPGTNEFTVSWERTLGHPFPDATGVWTLHGVANPVPLPGTLPLLLTALGVVGVIWRSPRMR